MRLLLVLAVTSAGALLLAGRRSSALGDRYVPACTLPASAEAHRGEAGAGCSPRTLLEVCGVPDGSIVHADGTITPPGGEPAACADPCSPSEYVLACSGAPTPADIPPPDPTLHCTIVPGATPAGTLQYCCPCAHDPRFGVMP